MIEKIDHIGIAVRNIEETLKLYRDILGLEVSEVHSGASERTAFIYVGGTDLELLEDLTSDGVIARHIERRGEGIQHICFKVDNIVEALQRLQQEGIALIDAQPRPGERNSRIAFLHPKGTHGVLIELCQREEEPKHT